MIKIKGETSYKETSSGIISRSKLLKLEIEGTKKGLDFSQMGRKVSKNSGRNVSVNIRQFNPLMSKKTSMNSLRDFR